jgi:citrate lyase subunit beta/citryl-CoA lyase
MSPVPARSYLYVPGDRADRLAGAVTRGADAVIADLEDSVGRASKAAAREAVRAWLAALPGGQLWVRVNVSCLAEDLAAVVRPGLAGVVLPKGEPALLAELDERLLELERSRGVGRLAVLPLIENAAGLLALPGIAGHPRVHRLGLGEVDLAADLGIELAGDRAEMLPVRLQLVIASAAAGIARPVGPTSTAFRDVDAFREGAVALRRLGFRARTAIHPAQIPVIHEVFTPSADDIARARDLIARFEAADDGGALDADGRFIDQAVARGAYELLATPGI